MDTDSISIAVIGKTGVGKSYFSNLILNNQKPKQGVFQVYDSLESGTQQPQVEMNKTIQYGNNEITLNVIDTPSFFDTNDHSNQQVLPQSITHLKNIFEIVQQQPFQQQLNKVILIFSCGQRFDVHHKGMMDMSTALFAKSPNLCVILTKCQNLYDQEIDDEEEIMKKLQNCQNQWSSQLALYGISEIYYLSGQPISRYQNKSDFLSQFYYNQWLSLYNSLKQSKKFFINSWEQQPQESRQLVQQYFNFQIPSQEIIQKEVLNEQKADENKAEIQQQDSDLQNQSSCLSLDVLINGTNSNIRVNNQFMNKKYKIQGLQDIDTSLGLIHYSNSDKCMFRQIQYKYQKGYIELNGYIELTNDHLIYCCNQQKFIPGKQLNIDDILLYKDGDQQQNVKITQISSVIKLGYYSPLTISGTFFGNGILLSCYVSPDSFPVTHEIAHIALKPLILYRQLTMKYDQRLSESNKDSNYTAPYAKVLQEIFCQEKDKFL